MTIILLETTLERMSSAERTESRPLHVLYTELQPSKLRCCKH